MNITYKSAQINDARILAEMNKRLIEDERHSNKMDIKQLTERMITWLQNEYSAYILLMDSGQVAGYCLFRGDQDCIYIRQFYIERNSRRQGLGSEQ